MLPEARAKALQLIELAEDAGLDVMFYDGWRDPDETQKNISKGTSKVADKFSSPHTWGIAFDIVFMRFGQPFWPPANDKKWQMLGKIGKNLGLKWGGDFTSFFDGPHFELPGISVSQLKKQYANDYLAFLKFNNVDVA
jgi:peptidoglycan L-alanyl-D-glutamate endopeptidase CwlK